MIRLFLLFFVLFARSLEAITSIHLPPGHFVYGLYDQLSAYRCMRPVITILQPQLYADIRSGVFLAEGHACNAPEWLLRKTQFLRTGHFPNQLYARMVATQNDVLPLQGTAAHVLGLFPEQQGRPYVDGGNLFLEGNLGVAAGGDIWSFAAAIWPGIALGLPNYNGFGARAYVYEGYLKIAHKNVEFSYGRMALGFGNPRHGSLLFSQAARPVDLFRLFYRPTSIGLGSLAAEIWYAPNQGDGLAIPHADLLAEGAAWIVNEHLEIGVTHIHQFGGPGAPKIFADDLLKMLFFVASSSVENSALAVHINAWLPNFWAKFYVQFLFGEGKEFSFLLGAFVPRLEDTHVRLEVVRTALHAYEHPLWTQGLVYQDTPLGHPLGKDALGIYADWGIALQQDWELNLGLQYESRLLSTASKETRISGSMGLLRRWGRFELEANLKLARVTNHLYVVGDNLNMFGASGLFRYLFY